MNALTRRGVIAVTALAICAIAGVGSATAYWTTGAANATASATAATLRTPAAPSVTSSGTTSLTVSGALPSNQLPGTAYTLNRGTATVQSCSIPSGATTFSCSDTGLAPGTTYSYTLSASLGAWTATSSTATGTTQCAAAPTFVVTPSTTTPTVGAAFGVTITKRSCTGATDTTFTGSQAITISGLSTSPSGKVPVVPATATFTAGVATGVSLTPYAAETTTITVTQGQVTGRSVAITVQQAPAYTLRLTDVTHSSNNASGPVDLACAAGSGSDEAPTTCSQTTPTLSGNGKAWGGTLTLVDRWGNVRTNTGAPIAITVANSAPGQPRTTVSIPTGASSVGFSFTGLPNGSGTSTVTIQSSSPALDLTITGVG